MRVIRQGQDPRLTPVTCTCAQCRSEIEFLPHEAKLVSDQREGDFYQLMCPVCSSTITRDVRK